MSAISNTFRFMFITKRIGVNKLLTTWHTPPSFE